MANWTQPICADCWNLRNPDRHAFALTTAEPERCCHCGQVTLSGIYVRVDPATVKFPLAEEDL
jgi:hypothetical protein